MGGAKGSDKKTLSYFRKMDKWNLSITQILKSVFSPAIKERKLKIFQWDEVGCNTFTHMNVCSEKTIAFYFVLWYLV